MKRDFEKTYHELEDHHWWFVARREIISTLLRLLYPQRDQAVVLEIGCSGGPLLGLLASEGFRHVCGIDLSGPALDLCRRRGVSTVVCADGVNLPFNDNVVDVLVASDVLEHIQEDREALLEWRRVLKEKGIVLCFVPALKILWSRHDELNEHQRRYSRKGLVNLFRESGFEVLRSSYWNSALFLPVLGYRIVAKLAPRSSSSREQLRATGPVANRILTRILRLENAILSRGVNFPVGISLMVIARRKL